MKMPRHIRRLALTAHISSSSVGWLGVVLAYLALAVTTLASRDAQAVRGTYQAMELIGWFVVVPSSLAALLTGLVQSLGTDWGLIRHYWVMVKLVLTIGATTIALLHMPAVSRVAGAAAMSSPIEIGAQTQLVAHAGGGLLVLLAITALSVFKPWGRTPYGRSQPQGEAAAGVSQRSLGLYLLVGTVALIVVMLAVHLARGGVHGH